MLKLTDQRQENLLPCYWSSKGITIKQCITQKDQITI